MFVCLQDRLSEQWSMLSCEHAVLRQKHTHRHTQTPRVSDVWWGCWRAGLLLLYGTVNMGPDRPPSPIKPHP